METFSALLAICAGNSPVTGEFHAQRPVTRSFYVFFDLRPNKQFCKQSRGWWFETPSCPLWRYSNESEPDFCCRSPVMCSAGHECAMSYEQYKLTLNQTVWIFLSFSGFLLSYSESYHLICWVLFATYTHLRGWWGEMSSSFTAVLKFSLVDFIYMRMLLCIVILILITGLWLFHSYNSNLYIN